MRHRRNLCVLAVGIGAAWAAATSAQDTQPVLEITALRASSFRAGVQLFAQPEELVSEAPTAALDPSQIEELRDAIEAGLKFSSVVLPLSRDAYLVPQATESIQGGPRADCGEWSQSGADAWVEGEIRKAAAGIAVVYQIWDSARCRRLEAETVDGQPANLRRLGKRIADRVVAVLTGRSGVSETEVAFVSTRTGNTEVFLMDADGGRARSATRSRSLKSSPSWLPQGGALLYTAFQKNGLPALFLTSRGGVRPGPFLRKTLAGRPKYRGVFSPKGDRVAIVSSINGEAEIFLVRPTGQDLQRLTKSPAIEVGPNWSPDGEQVAFVSDRSGSPQIYIIGADGEGERRVTFQGSYNTSPAWSPDGRWIAYETRVQGHIDIWMVDPSGEVNVPLVAHPRDDENPTWSPDGRKIAFSSNRRGQTDIYRVDIDGQNLYRLTHDSAENTQPAWSPFPRPEKDR